MSAHVLAVVGDINLGVLAGRITTPGVYKYDSAGNNYPHGHLSEVSGNVDLITSVAIDSIGNVYYGCVLKSYFDATVDPYWQAKAYTTFKTDPNGFLIWAVNHGAAVLGIAVDDSGNVYTVGDAVNSAGQVYPQAIHNGGGPTGNRSDYINARKYNINGQLIWSADSGFLRSFVETAELKIPLVYRDGALFIGGCTSNSGSSGWGALTKVDASTGAIIWRAAIPLGIEYFLTRDIVFDADDNALICGDYGNGIQFNGVLKISPAGNLLAATPTLRGTDNNFAWVAAIAIQSDGKVLAATTEYQYNGTNKTHLHRYDADLNYEAYYSAVYLNMTPRALMLDETDAIYIASSNSSYPTLFKYAPGATALSWSITTQAYGSNGGTTGLYALALRTVEFPPLPIRVHLEIPEWIGDRHVSIPGLPIPLALAAPTTVSDYIGPPMPFTHRLEFPGALDLTLGIESLQLRAVAGRISMTLVIPLPNESTLASIGTRKGLPMRVLRGVRLQNNIEQLSPLATVVLDSFAVDIGSSNASFTLSGSADQPIGVQHRRAVKWVSYRNTRDGRRRIRCAVDPYLKPGDIAELAGGETLMINEISIFENKDMSLMEINE